MAPKTKTKTKKQTGKVAEKKRRKAVRKDKVILIRATEAQKTALAEAAEKAGLGLSSWMLSVALREVQRTGSDRK